jgi:hypothetical protein
MSKENLLNNLNKIIRKDKYVDNVMTPQGEDLESIALKIIELSNEYFFDTMSLEGIAVYERQMDFKTIGTLEDRRQQIEARWKTAGKCSLELLQNIANSWRNGLVEIQFISGVIEVTFSSLVGVPSDLEGLKKAIGEAKPAHLGINYSFKYSTWGMVKDLGQTTQYWKDKGYTYTQMREQEVL